MTVDCHDMAREVNVGACEDHGDEGDDEGVFEISICPYPSKQCNARCDNGAWLS